jgi:hypothetical protein
MMSVSKTLSEIIVLYEENNFFLNLLFISFQETNMRYMYLNHPKILSQCHSCTFVYRIHKDIFLYCISFISIFRGKMF